MITRYAKININVLIDARVPCGGPWTILFVVCLMPYSTRSMQHSMQIPGTYRDAMSGNTQLGKAVRDACEELDTLAALEMETLNEAEQLLKKVGFKGSLFNKEP
jgi:hypothetical protein